MSTKRVLVNMFNIFKALTKNVNTVRKDLFKKPNVISRD